MNRWYRLAGTLLGVAVIFFFIAYAMQSMDSGELSRLATIPAITGIVTAAVCYAAVIPLSAWAWQRLLRDVGAVVSWRESVRIMAISQMAKYLPGNIGQHVGRAVMSAAYGIKIGKFSLTVYVELLLAVLAALSIGLAGMALIGLDFDGFGPELAVIGILAMLLLAGLPVFERVLLFILKNRAHDDFSLGALPGHGAILRAFLIYCLNYFMVGLGLMVLACFLFPEAEQELILLTSSFALAWVAGWLTPGAPAGLGVRDAVMLGLLASAYESHGALLLVIAFRLSTMLGDLLCFAGGYLTPLPDTSRIEPDQD